MLLLDSVASGNAARRSHLGFVRPIGSSAAKVSVTSRGLVQHDSGARALEPPQANIASG